MTDNTEFKVHYSRPIGDWDDSLITKCESPEVALEIEKRWNAYEGLVAREQWLAEQLAEHEEDLEDERGMGERGYDETCTAAHWLKQAQEAVE